MQYGELTMRRARGFGLIEVLITLLVFSIGALAVAGLQVVSKKNNHNALQRNTAVRLAHSIATSMRANPDALSDYLIETKSPRGSGDSIPAPDPSCYETTCNPTDLAAFDLWQWERMLEGASETASAANNQSVGGLIAPSACIQGPGDGSAGIYRITVVWRGVTPVEQSSRHACGSGRGLYSAPGGSSGETYQRSFTLETYIRT